MPLRTFRKVIVANGIEEVGERIGTIKLNFLNSSNQFHSAKVENVLYVLKIDRNLLSVTMLIEKRNDVKFDKRGTKVFNGDKEIAIADLHEALYKLRQSEMVNAVTECGNMCIHYWHRVLAHRDPEAIKQLEKKTLSEEIISENCNMKQH